MLGEMVEKPEKADRFEGSDVRPARERACRRRSPSIFHRVIFYGFSYSSSFYRFVGALIRALSAVVFSGVINHQWRRCVWSNDASGWRMGVVKPAVSSSLSFPGGGGF